MAFKQYKKLPYTFIYLFAFFLLADVSLNFSFTNAPINALRLQGLNTTGTLVSICQNDKFEFSFLQNTYLGLAQAITSTASTFGFWYIQRYWKINTKKMVSIYKFFYSEDYSFTWSVCCYECVLYLYTLLGHVGDLDYESWVRKRHK